MVKSSKSQRTFGSQRESKIIPNTCDQCSLELKGDNKKRGGRCRVARYCSKNCQSVAWKSGHKEKCFVAEGDADSD